MAGTASSLGCYCFVLLRRLLLAMVSRLCLVTYPAWLAA